MIRLAVWGRAAFRGNTDPFSLIEPFACEKICWQNGERSDKTRAQLNCNRIDLPSIPWDVSANALARRPTYHLGDSDDTGKPRTESFEQGCPGAWYRVPFIYSLYPYLRERADNGARNTNPFFDQCSKDPLIVEAVLYWETEQCRWNIRHRELINKEHQKEAKK